MESITGFRLSPRQRHLWSLGHGSGAADARALFRLRGALDVDALRAAVAALVARHEVLRTRFERLPGMPEALQAPGEAEVRWGDDADLSSSPDVEAFWDSGDDGDLPAARLVRVGDAEHLLLLRLHPLSVDGASFGHLARDLAALYAAERGGAAVDDEPVPYLAVSEWLNEVGESPEAQEGRAWWARQWQAADAALPVEREPSSFDAATAQRILPAELSAALRGFGHARTASADAVLLAGWAALLHRLGGAAEARVAVAFDGRTDDGLEQAVGPFTQDAPLGMSVDGSRPFAALVERVRGAMEDAAGWLECFDAEAVRALARGDAEPPRIGFTALPASSVHSAGGGVEIEIDRMRVAEDAFALHLRVHASGDGIALELAGGGTVPRAQLELLLERLETLLADALARPDAPLASLAAMSAAERRRLLEDFSRDDSWAGADAPPVHERFQERASRRPDASAIRFGEATVSYGELNARANRLARHLRSLGVGAETRVGIMLPSSPERVEAVLAVLKAGAAWVPLDPAYPHDRLAFMMADAALPLVLTDADLRGRVPAVDGAAVIAREEIADAVDAQPADDLAIPVDARAAAYVIYTSGSTGTPKGVVVEHGPLATHAAAVQAHYGLGESDRILQFASFNFDASVEQTLPPLAAGACVVLRREAISTVESLGRYVADGLTILNLPTAQWHLLAEAWAAGEAVPDLSALRLVIAGGEAMLPGGVARWRQTPAAGATLLNAYGPTEAVVTASTFAVPAELGGAAARVPVGRPFGGRAAYVLDASLSPAPIGAPGELHLGGATLARGYLGRPALTAERFIPDPFSAEAGARMYRTGDLARFGEDGVIDFLGRADHQVKVRGFRIELGEVETALNRHPAVRQSAVVVEEKGGGEKQLVAYWVPDGEALEPSALRAFLLQRLPDHMVPGVFIALETMPLTAVGKIDRRTLPQQRRIRAERPVIAPATPVEEQVAAIWAEVMRSERVSMDDNFFASGGHSLLATQLTSRLRRHFGIDLQIGRVFDAATLADLARTVEAMVAAGQEDEDGLGSISRAPREGHRVRLSEVAALVDS